MSTVIEIIHRLFPNGTNRAAIGHQYFPMWPPDMFAIAATLVEKTGCYTHKHFGGYSAGGMFASDEYLKEVARLATGWTNLTSTDLSLESLHPIVSELGKLWQVLLDSGNTVVRRAGEENGSDGNPVPAAQNSLKWLEAAMKLLAISDEASAGLGFPLRPETRSAGSSDSKSIKFVELVYDNYKQAVNKEKPDFLPAPLQTLCLMVPSEELCVQPKAVTPQVGCSLRSLTHHLALLPSVGEVKTQWMILPDKKPVNSPLNLLLVPYPYQIEGSCFNPGGISIDSTDAGPYQKGKPNFFAVSQKWLDGQTDKKIADELLFPLIQEAHREVGRVHGIILPELALEHDLAEALAKRLAKDTDLELFITGVTSNKLNTPASVNAVYGCIFDNHESKTRWIQTKHHRWKLDGDQIRRYHLGNSLLPEGEWWERIDIHNRYCYFYLFRPGAALTALVCEDLARIDPVQSVLRAIGPNLVIALLMDGPQLPYRWPSRYATVLADDPGSAVLTLTSLGMLRRSIDPGDAEPNTIGLWKDSLANKAIELKLPSTAHALLLTITSSRKNEYTLDGRSDQDGTVRLKLMGVRPIVHNPPHSDFGR